MSKKTMQGIIEALDFEALIEYVHSRCEFDGTGCWLWSATTGGGLKNPVMGVGRLKSSGGRPVTRPVRAVIGSMMQEIKGFPKPRVVRNSCGERLCVNPDHIVPIVTVGEWLEFFEKNNDWDGFVDYLDANSKEVESVKYPDNPCWEWTGTAALSGSGYLVVTGYGEGSNVLHRIVAGAFRGGVPTRTPVHHKCANVKCVQPDHLQITTHKQNLAEMLGRNWYESRIESAEEILSSLLPHIKDKHYRNRVESFLAEAA